MKPLLLLIFLSLSVQAAHLDLNEQEIAFLPTTDELTDADELSSQKLEVSESVKKGLTHLSNGEYEKARLAFDKGVKEEQAPAFFALGSFYERGYIDKSGVRIEPDPDKARDYYAGAVKRGHTIAKFNLGVILLSAGEKGKGMALIEEVANAGKVNAMNRLGDLYRKGEFITQDTKKAASWYQKAHAQGSTLAAFNLGTLYASPGPEQNLSTAQQWYEKAAKAGLNNAYLALAKLHLNGPLRNLEKASQYMEKHVDGGDNTAFFHLAQLKENLESLDVALPYYKRAAEYGHPLAQHRMGDYHSAGNNQPRDMETALQYYKKAAAQGLPVSMYNAASILRVGDGVEKEEKEAGRLLKLSAQRGYMLAQFDLAMALQRGMGMEKDPSQALRWFNQAARQGYAPAKFEIGKALENGIGIDQSPIQSVTHYLHAAQQGLPIACYKMASLCLDGKILKKDPIKAYAFLLGIKHRTPEIENTFKELNQHLSDWDKVEAREIMLNQYETIKKPSPPHAPPPASPSPSK